MKIYISGRVTGLDFVEVKEMFAQAADQIKAANHMPVNPIENGLPANASWEDHMVKDVELLLKCDGIYRLNGWNDSKGARIENYIAEQQGMEVIDQPGYAAYTRIFA